MERGPGAWGRPSGRSRALDVTLAVSAAALDCLTRLLADGRDGWLPGPASALVAALFGLSLLTRRGRPRLLAALAVAVSALTGTGGVAVVIAFYSLGAYGAPRRAVIALAVAAIGVLAALPSSEPGWHNVPVRLLFATVFVATPVLLGLYMGARKQLVASLQERAERLEREQTLLAERARVEERARIAREMHDVVANRISVMVVHAGALRAVAARDPDRAAQTATVIGEMGRQALDELRHVIGVLRLGDAAEPLPTPTMDGFRELVAQSTAAGLRVELDIECTDGELPPAVARTAYRVVQEGLTNVHKHAGGAATTVVLRRLPDAVEALVRNGPPPARGADHALPGGGNGLRGLRERVVALGGGFGAGPCADGGFEVIARIPVPAQGA